MDTNFKLSPHFTVGEFERSERAKKYLEQTKDPIWHNKMPVGAINAARLLCENVLEVVRAHFGTPIYISSGYRMPRLNKAVKGAVTSQHMKGEAADIYIQNKELPLKAVFVWMVKNCDYDQIIWETRPSGSKWIHVSHRLICNRHTAMTCADGKNYVRYEYKK